MHSLLIMESGKREGHSRRAMSRGPEVVCSEEMTSPSSFQSAVVEDSGSVKPRRGHTGEGLEWETGSKGRHDQSKMLGSFSEGRVGRPAEVHHIGRM